jgi:hypothetical protein
MSFTSPRITPLESIDVADAAAQAVNAAMVESQEAKLPLQIARSLDLTSGLVFL